MKNHGVKPEKLYPTMTEEPAVVYPNIFLPASVFEGHMCQIGDTYRVEVVIKLRSMNEHEYSGDLIESEIESDASEKKEDKEY